MSKFSSACSAQDLGRPSSQTGPSNMAAAAARVAETRAKVSAGNAIPTFVVIGAAGDGKSSLVKKLLSSGAQEQPEVGKRGEGVTKCVTEYSIEGLNGEQWSLIDTMGVGDHERGVTQLIAGLKHVLQCGRQVDGLIVTTLLASSRLGTAAQILQQIIKHGMVRDDFGVSPWERVIICGTQRDRCDDDEIAEFPQIGGLFFKDCGVTPKEYQIATCSTKQPDGMAELLAKVAGLGRQHVVWDPNFEDNGGVRRMAAGVCQITGGNVTLTQLDLQKQLAWTELVKQETLADFTSSGGAAVGEGAVLLGGKEVTKNISASVGREVISQYTANQAATGVGSGVIRGGVQIAKGSEVAVGQSMMNAMKEGGTATLKSRAGNVVVDVGAKSALSQGVSAGASFGAGLAGISAEFVAGQFEATREHKKPIGFAAHVGTAAAIGSAGGPMGAAAGAGVGVISWVSGQVLGHVIETIVINSKGEDNPKVLAYANAKAKYDAACRDAAR